MRKQDGFSILKCVSDCDKCRSNGILWAMLGDVATWAQVEKCIIAEKRETANISNSFEKVCFEQS